MKLVYPAVFYAFEGGKGYTVEFPDLPGCVTQGTSLEEALEMAADASAGWILSAIEDGDEVPKPSVYNINDFDDAVYVNYILIDMDSYAKQYGDKAVKKTLSIPKWLNTMAEKENINFSHILQNALKRELGLTVKESSAETRGDLKLTINENCGVSMPLFDSDSSTSVKDCSDTVVYYIEMPIKYAN